MVKSILAASVMGSLIWVSCLAAEEVIKLEGVKASLEPTKQMQQEVLKTIRCDSEYLTHIKVRDERTMIHLAHQRGFHFKDEISWAIIEKENFWGGIMDPSLNMR